MDRENILNYYALEVEAHRLELEIFKLESIRTKEIIDRYIVKKEMEIADVGGGAGHYSFWLQDQGHQVSLVDLSPKNIELVRSTIQANGRSLKNFEIGDAVNLNFPDEQFDIVLLMGPLYHMTEQGERIKALSEAKRVLKRGGILLAAVISRYASLIDGFRRDLVTDDYFFSMLTNDLMTGIHINETDNPEYFTTAYFHEPKQIMMEISEGGLRLEKLIPVESFGWMVPNFNQKLKNPEYMKKLLGIIRMMEENEDLLSISPHIIAIARKE